MRKYATSNILFSKVRQGVLATTYLNPERWWFLSELARHLRLTPSSLQRELETLVTGGVLRTKREGKQVYFRAEVDSPIYKELRGIILKTVGLSDVLQRHLTPFKNNIDFAFIYGSLAKSEERVGSDVDLMIIGNTSLVDLSQVLRKAENELNRSVNVYLNTISELNTKFESKHHFILEVLKSKKIFLIGNENDLVKIIGK